MITFLTSFKPFVGDDALRQRQALLSWLALDDGVEVMVFGRAEGLEAVVGEPALVHYPDVDCIDGRLPRADAIFEIAQEHGRHELQAYVNADIILGPDFLRALLNVPFPRFLMVGATWRADIWADAEVRIPDDLPEFRTRALARGRVLGTGADFFAYRRGSLRGLPPLAVGAVAWDNYMIEHCRRRGVPVVDATDDVLAIHQRHDYARVPTGGRTTEEGTAAEHNLRIVGDGPRYVVRDASHVLVSGALRPGWTSLPHLCHRLGVLPARSSVWRRWRRPFTYAVRLLCVFQPRALHEQPRAHYAGDEGSCTR